MNQKMSKPRKDKLPVKRPKKANGYEFPDKLPVGEILKDVAKKEWIIGPSIGKGGFGEIYSAAQNNSKIDSYLYAVKIEPHENGPLFMEKNFYIKVAKSEDVEAWRKSNNIKILGIPSCHGSGSHCYKDKKYRFMVLERFGQDLASLLMKNKHFPPVTVYRCAIQILDVLNYIHDKDYVHGDIKGANLLLGLKKGTENNIFLVDFGLACRYTTKEYKKDPKQAHNGTIQYTSCDWHNGVPTRRGDFEILGYNLLHWLNSSLPWEGDIKNNEKVHEKKKQFMNDVPKYMEQYFPNVPKVLKEYMSYVSKLKYDEKPDYSLCKNLFIKELEKLKTSIVGKFDFTTTANNEYPNSPDIFSSEDNFSPIRKRGRMVGLRNSPRLEAKLAVLSPRASNLDESNASSEENFSPPRRGRRKAGKVVEARLKKSPTLDSLDLSDNVPSSEDVTPVKRSRVAKNGNGKTKLFSVKNNLPGKTKNNKKNKDAANKISWRDAPTIKAGCSQNVAGVYVKKRSDK